MKLLDSSIWLDHLAEANERSVIIIESTDELATSILSLFEIKKKLIKLNMENEKIESSINFIKKRSTIININEEIIDLAVEFSIKNKLATVDSLIYASAVHMKAELITADKDFKGLFNVEIIEG